MQVSNPNNVKIYNLSAGKSLPQWLSDRRRRTLLKQDVELRRRIELIQDFDMPTVSNSMQISKDQQYIFASGVYKPRVRCYDLNNLGMKFERCFDSEIVKFLSLADDYSKLAFLQCDRFVEFHAQHGKYYRTRIPKYGRDLDFHSSSCDLYIVGASSEVYRLNLEQGRFLNSLKTDASEIMCCQFNPVHELFACGTKDGHVECWDPRVRTRVGKLDLALSSFIEDLEPNSLPAVTSLRFKNGLHFGIGTSTGQVVLYDLRWPRPLLVKDHMYGLPIRNIVFQPQQDLVLSCDQRILKIWNEKDGKAFTSIEPENTKLTDLQVFPNSGLLFMTNEAPKILVYYIPSLGPAPKWCNFLDSLTEELEENPLSAVYDDYKFVGRSELDRLGMSHLIGSNLLRAYMHGYFMDVRLYNKAKSIADPFAYEEYRRNKIKEKLEEARKSRVQVKKMPKVNRMLAEKLMDQEDIEATKNKKKATEAAALLKDSRFTALFENPDFEVDTESTEYRLLNPVVTKLDKGKKRKTADMDEGKESDEEPEGRGSSDESSDDEHTWSQEVKEQHRKIQLEEKMKRKLESQERRKRPKFVELDEGSIRKGSHETADKRQKLAKRSLGDRLKTNSDSGVIHQSGSARGAMELTFKIQKNQRDVQRRQEAQLHHSERRKIRRSAHELVRGRGRGRGGLGRGRGGFGRGRGGFMGR